MHKIKLSLNLTLILTLLFAFLLNPSAVARAGNDKDELKADPRLLQLAQEHPDDTFLVIVQREIKNKDLKDADPETEVEKAGGQVKKQLQMIESFSAELSGKEVAKLAKHPKVRWISLDAPVVSNSANDPKVRDDFNAIAYNNSNGTQSWSGNWVESSDDNTPGNGNVKIANGTLQLKYGNRAIRRSINLSGAVYAALTVQFKRSGFDDSSDYVALQISKDGGLTWTELGRASGPGTDSTWLTSTFYIQNYSSSNTQIRFVTSLLLGSSDILYVDDVQIEYAYASKYTAAIRADQAWQANLKGQGVTVAVVDSGISSHYDFVELISSRVIASTNQTSTSSTNDGYGHGTHVAGILGGNGNLSGGTYTGVAPKVNLINVKVNNDIGMALASDLIDGLQWILNHKSTYNIKAVNISLNSLIPESYQTSPLDAAVEILWFNGIVVVTSAGNNGTGNGPVALYPPANDPFVITVGSVEDKGTATLSDDSMAFFSAYGTTEDNFAKPDLVAPGMHVVSTLASSSAYAYVNHVAHRVDGNYFRMSGTSMSAPMVSGAVAVLLQHEPNLTPDQVKYRLMTTANKSWGSYDAEKAGAGYLDVYAAVSVPTTEASNIGILPSQLLSTGSEPISWGSVGWNSVGWNSVGWNSVGWNSVGWNSVGWNSICWNTSIWDD